MNPFTLERTQTLPITLETAWKFFSNPANLVKINPAGNGIPYYVTAAERDLRRSDHYLLGPSVIAGCRQLDNRDYPR